MKKPSLLTLSLVAHGALAFGLVVSGIWHIDQLDPGRHTINIGMVDEPAPSGSPATPAVMPKMVPKQHITKDIVQPVKKLDTKPDTVPEVAVTDATTPGNGAGSGSGSGDNPDGTPGDTGTCKGVGCVKSAPTTPPPCTVDCDPPKKKTVVVVPPMMLAALRYAGNTNITPSDTIKQEMVREDHKHASAAFRVCLGTSGEITSVTRIASTKYAEYDDALARGIHGWSYHPYLIKEDGRDVAVPACGMVTFNYSIN